MNEKGLAANLLYLAENDFGLATADMKRPRLSFGAWTLYLLSQYATVRELVAAVQQDRIQIVPVPFGPGGTTDILARNLQKVIEEKKLLPQPVVIQNVGGHFSVGARQALTAAPDGYTFLVIHLAIMSGEIVDPRRGLSYRDFAPVALTGGFCLHPIVRADSPYKSLKDLLDREAVAGGAPRHTDHLGFGLRDLHRLTSGPRYARRLLAAAQRAGGQGQLAVVFKNGKARRQHQGGRGHAGADQDGRRLGAECAHPREGVGRVAAGVAPGLEMVAHEHRVEARFFGQHGKVQQCLWAELLSGRLVSKFKHRWSPLNICRSG
jgi:hypothetical protein